MISAQIKDTQINIGDIIRVHTKVVEGSRSRIQVFEGILIRVRGRAENQTFTVRKIGSSGIGVERTWPIDANIIEKVEVKKKAGHVRRSKLYYLRNLVGKSAVRV